MQARAEQLKHFLQTAPGNWQEGQQFKAFQISQTSRVLCVLWEGKFYISGTDIVKILSERLRFFGREIVNEKKFQEGVFSDLRAVKPGKGAIIEQVNSDFLTFLRECDSVRTRKKQKVFEWFAVSHDALFETTLRREITKEQLGIPTFSKITGPSVDLCHIIGAYNGSNYMFPDDFALPGNLAGSRTEFEPNYNLLLNDQVSEDLPASLAGSLAGSLAFGTPLDLPLDTPLDLPLDSLAFAKCTDFEPSPVSSSFPGFIVPLPAAKTVEDDRPYSCQWSNCCKTFKRLEHVKRHYRTHTNERPYKCKEEGCDKSFSRSDNLKCHERRHYKKDSVYKCQAPGCTSIFLSNGNLNAHVQSAHKGLQAVKSFPEKCMWQGCTQSLSSHRDFIAHTNSHHINSIQK